MGKVNLQSRVPSSRQGTNWGVLRIVKITQNTTKQHGQKHSKHRKVDIFLGVGIVFRCICFEVFNFQYAKLLLSDCTLQIKISWQLQNICRDLTPSPLIFGFITKIWNQENISSRKEAAENLDLQFKLHIPYDPCMLLHLPATYHTTQLFKYIIQWSYGYKFYNVGCPYENPHRINSTFLCFRTPANLQQFWAVKKEKRDQKSILAECSNFSAPKNVFSWWMILVSLRVWHILVPLMVQESSNKYEPWVFC